MKTTTNIIQPLRNHLQPLALAGVVLCLGTSAQASPYLWANRANNSTGEWTTEGSWTTAGYPNIAGDYADFGLETTAPSGGSRINVTVASGVTVGDINCGGKYAQGTAGSVQLLSGTARSR